MSEPFPTRVRRVVEEHSATAIGLSTVAFLTTVWSLQAPGIYRWLYAALEDKGILALIFVLFTAAIWCWMGWRSEKKREKPFFERLIPVAGSGYSRDPKHREFACPRCASEDRKAYLAQISDDGLYCQSCGHGVKRFKARE